jgi:hypothetical protein
MKHLRHIIIISGLALAHGGFEHVQGTVVKVENSVLTVKTTKGNETVKLNAKTEFTRNAKAAQAADLKAGTRVVVEIEEGDKTRTAHSIKLGAASVK